MACTNRKVLEHESVDSLLLITSGDQARQRVLDARRRDLRVGLVPTMGALHEGHLSLVRQSLQECDFTVVSIFVNPTQFGPGEDFDEYPRNLDRDVDLLKALNVDLAFAPEKDEMFKVGHSTFVQPPAVSEPWEGTWRPGHFRGVTTAVLKLFHLLPADVAFFGRKDYQQGQVIRQMVYDLDLPIGIQLCETIRDEDGLALSSRNGYLTPPQRAQATAVPACLRRARELYQTGCRSGDEILAQMRALLEEAGITNIDYLVLADPVTLAEQKNISDETVALLAVYVGKTRLIDNQFLGH